MEPYSVHQLLKGISDLKRLSALEVIKVSTLELIAPDGLKQVGGF